MPITIQSGPNPGVVGMAAFAGGMNKAKNDAARQYLPLVEEQNRQRFAKQQAQMDWEQQYNLAMMHLAASGVTADRHQQFIAQQNALNRESRERTATIDHPDNSLPPLAGDGNGGGIEQGYGQGQEYGLVPQEQGQGGVASIPPAGPQDVLRQYLPQGGTQSQSVYGDPQGGGYGQGQGHGYVGAAGESTLTRPEQVASREQAAGHHVQYSDADRFQRPASSLGQTQRNAPMGYGSSLPYDYQNPQQQQASYAQYDQQAAANSAPGANSRVSLPNLGITGHAAQDRQAARVADSARTAQGLPEGYESQARPGSHWGHTATGQTRYMPDMPDAPAGQPLAASGLNAPLPSKHQELYGQYQQILGQS